MNKNRSARRIALVVAMLGTVGVAVVDGGGGDVLAAPPPATASSFTALTPQRLVDTRNGLGGVGGRLAASSSIDVQVTGKLGVPATATAVEVNITAVNSGGRGYVQVIPKGRAAIGSSSTLNVDAPGQTIPNAAFAPLGEGGQLTVFTTFETDIVIDVAGYFTPVASATSGRLVPLTPKRILDTRVSLGWTPPATTVPPTTPGPVTTAPPVVTVPPVTSAPPVVTTPPATITPATTTPPTRPPNPGDAVNCTSFATYAAAKAWFDTYFPYYGDVAHLDSDGDGIPCETLPGAPHFQAGLRTEVVSATTIIPLQVAGVGGVPSEGVSAVVMNVTAVDPVGDGFIQVAPTPVSPGSSSNLNTAAGSTIANLVVVPLGTGGKVDLYANVSTELLADVVGYFTSTSAPNSTAGLFVPIAPTRQMDTRDPAPQPPVAIGTTRNIDVSAVAPDAIAVAGNLTVTESQQFGYLQVAAPPLQAGSSSNVNVAYTGQTIANAFVSPIAGGIVSTYNNSPMHEIVDITGWFTQAAT